MRLSEFRTAFGQLIRYGIIGLTTNLVGYGIYLLITTLGADPKLTMTLGYIVGATIGYTGNKKLTFRHEGNWLGSTIRYAIAHSIGYGVNFLLLHYLVDVAGYPHQYVQGGAIFVVAGVLFVLFKFFVFPARPAPPVQD